MTTLTLSGISTSGRSRIRASLASALFLFVAGAWLAVLQVGLFLSLELLLSSAFLTYVVLVLSWLVGAAIGAWIPRGPWTIGFMWASGLVPYLSMGLLKLAPFNTSLILLHGVLVLVTALYAGQIFQQERASFARVGTLFFWENTGFTVGLVIGVAGFVLLGRGFLHAAPGAGLALVLLLAAGRRYLIPPPAVAETPREPVR